ncbi:hypothetical protein ACTA71_006513 [Dictyostelium dimigraforme]
MKLILLLFTFFYFFNNVYCNNNFTVVDLQYVKETHSNESSFMYILEERHLEEGIFKNFLWGINTSDPNTKITFPLYYVPLENPKLLGSFSNDSIFIIGSKYLGLLSDNNKIRNDFLKSILLTSSENNYHYSMNLQDDGKSIDFYSMSIKRNLGIDYFSISVENLNISDTNFEEIIDLNTSTNYKLFITNISVDRNSIGSFQFSHDKDNNIYFCLIKEKGFNNTWIVSLDNGSLGMFKVDLEDDVIFGNIIFTSIGYKSMVFSFIGKESKLMVVSCDLRNNSTIIKSGHINGPYKSNQVITETSKNYMIFAAYNGKYYLQTFSSIDFSFKSERQFLFEFKSNYYQPILYEHLESISTFVNSESSNEFNILTGKPSPPPPLLPHKSSINSIYLVYRRNRIENEIKKSNGMIIVAILVPVITVSLVGIVGFLYYIIVIKKNKPSNEQKEIKLEKGNDEIPKDQCGAEIETD